jgi:putative PIN family toxin of toxin-antitoxin system
VRVFLDTNVWVAAFAARGLCEALLDECLVRHEVLTSTLVWEELKDVLARKLAPSPQSWKEIEALGQSAVSVADAPPQSGNNDTRLLEAAVAAAANAFVTGDKALLHQRRFRTMPIVSPREVYERLIRGG